MNKPTPNLNRIEHYFGTYQNSIINLRYNRIKFTTICVVLDYFAMVYGFTGNIVPKSKNQLVEMVLFQAGYKKKWKVWNKCRNKKNRLLIKTALEQMIMMGLLCSQYGLLTVTDYGREAYKGQEFHKALCDISATLQSRTISIIAVVVALISLLLTLLLRS
ncbi:MAG: hypothetical protein LIP02_14555 [Bacteroidales bacterium]|nr:hypothetical protein [Bacteroidales bacterium]